MTKSIVTCDCAQVAIELEGAPLICAECHCTSCRQAAVRLEQLPLARPMLEGNAGTQFVLYRKDRVQILRGQHLLEAFRLGPKAPTRRVISRCCNSPVFLEFQSGHWLSLYASLWPEETRPTPQLRTMTGDRTDHMHSMMPFQRAPFRPGDSMQSCWAPGLPWDSSRQRSALARRLSGIKAEIEWPRF